MSYFFALILLLLTTSVQAQEPSNVATTNKIIPKSDDLKAAKDLYEQRCFQCHGKNGAGNGPMSVHLDPKPRNLQNKDWQKQVSDLEIKKIIIGGGGVVQKSILMPANPDLRSKPKVIEALIYLIRSFDTSSVVDESNLPLNQP